MNIPGRGATINPGNRFEKLEVTLDEEYLHEAGRPRTIFYRDDSQSIISRNDSPDIGFNVSVNPYRGCEHGCSYCYARPTHEYLGFSPGLEFETRIMVKPNAPDLLRKELSSPKWVPQFLAMSGVTDCYQPIEKKLEITRSCLQVLLDFRQPVGIVTKNYLVTRDIDVLSELAKFDAATVYITITTLDAGLARKLEPRAASPSHRLDAIRQLSEAGIPVGVLMAPIIPGLTDHEIPSVLQAAKAAGAYRASYTMLRLPYGVKDVFAAWLEEHLPQAKDKILERVRDLRGGELNNSRFGERMRGQGIWAEHIKQMFTITLAREGLNRRQYDLSIAHFRNPEDRQMRLF